MMRLLAVDDDPFILQMLRLALKADGYNDVSLAEDATAAERMVAEAVDPFDLFLLDIQMPGKSGIELCQTIRANECYRDVPIIMLTAMSEKHYIDHAFKAGASDYLCKPFDTIELHARVRTARRSAEDAKDRVHVQRQLASVVTSISFQPALDFEDSLDIDDLSNFLSFDRFHNFLRQTLRGRYPPSALYGVKIPVAAQLYGGLKSKDFINFIGDVGDAISEAVLPFGEYITYAGSGYFLVALRPDGIVRPPDEICETICEMARALGVKRPDGQPKKLTFIVGNPVIPAKFTADEADEAIGEAVKAAERAAIHSLTVEVGSSLVQANRFALRLG